MLIFDAIKCIELNHQLSLCISPPQVSTEFMNGKRYTFDKEKFRMVHGKVIKEEVAG